MIKLLITALKYYGGNPGNWKFPWCAVFINMILKENDIKFPKSLMARSALKIGVSVKTPEPGDIVVLWRIAVKSPWGHSGIFVYDDKENVFLLGGNQDNRVKIKPYPKTQILDIRRINVKKPIKKV